MVYAYDLWALMPVKDLYDSQMMAIIINAAKDQYDLTKADMKEFNKEYGDFVSPFQKDMDLYGSTIGRIKDIVNNADIHTQAGRAAIQKAINSVDPRLYNQMRANAKMGYAYQDTLQKLAAQGKFDKDMNDWWLRNKLGVGSFEDFSTAGSNGALNSWNVSSPIQAATLQQLTDDLYKGLDARDLSAAEAKEIVNAAYDPRAKYTGNTFGDLLKVAREGVPGLTGDPRLDYFREMSRQKALVNNPNASAADIENLFQRDVANANIRYMRAKGDLSQYNADRQYNISAQRLAATILRNNILRSKNGASKDGSNSSKTPTSYYDNLYQDLVVNNFNLSPNRSEKFANQEYSPLMGEGMLATQRSVAEEYFGGNNMPKSMLAPMYNITTTMKPKLFGDTSVKGSILSAYNRLSSVQSKSAVTSLTDTKNFYNNFTKRSEEYLDRFSIDYPSSVFAGSWNGGRSKIENVTSGKEIYEKLNGLNYISVNPGDVNKIYSREELAARAAGITGKTLEKAIARTKYIRSLVKANQDNAVMQGLGKALGVASSDDNKFGTYGGIRLKYVDGNEVKQLDDAYVLLPRSSMDTPGGIGDDVNLTLSQKNELYGKTMDNAALKLFGVSNNSATADPTIPDVTTVYDLYDYNDDLE